MIDGEMIDWCLDNGLRLENSTVKMELKYEKREKERERERKKVVNKTFYRFQNLVEKKIKS